METKKIYELFLRCGCRFSTDSRRGEGLFFALRGERHDAHDFVSAALGAGAAYAVVERLVEGVPSEKLVVVESTERALQDLARHHRRQFRIPVIGITGTNGKTTTKELLAAALSAGPKAQNHSAIPDTGPSSSARQSGSNSASSTASGNNHVLYTQGNLNNHLGVPMTLLRLSPLDDIAVIEMGASHVGEIELLCGIAEPTHGLITNIGNAHLEGFGSPEGVIRAKSELFRYLAQTGGTAFFNGCDAILRDLVVGKIEGLHAVAFTPPCVTTSPNGTLQFTHLGTPYPTHLTGSYNAANIGAALALADAMHIPATSAAEAISTYHPSNNRSQIITTAHNTLIMDAYNANPTSMLAALENLASTPGGPKMAILGQMNELGSYSADAHAQVVDYASSHGVSLMLVGRNFLTFADSHAYFATTDELISHLRTCAPRGSTILIKGSNSMRLFTLPEQCPEL